MKKNFSMLRVIFIFLLKTVLGICSFVLIVFPIALYILNIPGLEGFFSDYEKIRCCKTDNVWKTVLLITCLVTLILLISLSFFLNKGDKISSLAREVKYLLKNGFYAFIGGLALSNLLISLYFFIPAHENVDRFNTSIGIYLGVLTIVLGIHWLYEKEAPIIGTRNLLEKLLIDLHNACSPRVLKNLRKIKVDFICVFPALNLGFYTEYAIDERLKSLYGTIGSKIEFKETNDLSSQFYYMLKHIAAKYDDGCNLIGVTYDEEHIRNLYEVYHYMIKYDDEYKKLFETEEAGTAGTAGAAGAAGTIKELDITKLKNDIATRFNTEDKSIVDACVKSAIDFKNYVKCTEVLPNYMIQPVIVINDIVYIIADYGLPVYDGKENYFIPIKNENEPVELICWRRKDAALAKAIKEHISEFCRTITGI